MNKETQEVYKRGQAIAEMLKSDGWMYASDMFTEQLTELVSVTAIADDADFATEVVARKRAYEMLKNFMGRVEGIAEQHTNQNKQAIEEQDHFERFENRETAPE